MRILSLELAENFLNEGAKLNPGAWIDHSVNVARAASIIAENCPNLNKETAYIFGLIHDIGRREGIYQLKHVIDGYKFLIEQGYDAAARICMTHSFPYKNINYVAGEWDCYEEERQFIDEYINRIEYDEYDLLIQLCDAIALSSGYCLLEKRLVDVALRYGTNDLTVDRWKATFGIKNHFEEKIGKSIYTLLSGVVSNTFGASIEELK